MGDLGSMHVLERSTGEGDNYPFQYSGLENSMDCIVHGVTKNQTRLNDFHLIVAVTKKIGRMGTRWKGIINHKI